MENTLKPYKHDISVIVSGGAQGADKLAERFAKKYNIPTTIFMAQWIKYGKSAGFIRNKEIIDTCDAVVAFWDEKSPGTKHSLTLAKQQNKPIKIIKCV